MAGMIGAAAPACDLARLMTGSSPTSFRLTIFVVRPTKIVNFAGFGKNFDPHPEVLKNAG